MGARRGNMCGIYPLNPLQMARHTTGWVLTACKGVDILGKGHIHHPQHKRRDLLNHLSPVSSSSAPRLACSAEPVPRRGWSLDPNLLQGSGIQEVSLTPLASPSPALQQLSPAPVSSSGIPDPSLWDRTVQSYCKKNKFHRITSLRHQDNHLEMIKYLLVFEMKFGAQRDPCTA